MVGSASLATAAHASAELRTTLGPVDALVIRGEIGSIALADIGRVFVTGEQSDRWHTAFGGGAWFATIEQSLTVHLLYAYGERHTLHAGIGLPF